MKQIKKLENGNNLINYQIPLEEIPGIMQKYTLLRTKAEILEKTYKIIYPQIEAAKLQELRDTPTIQIIDKAVPAGKRTRPRRGMLCIVTFIISAIVLMLMAVVLEMWERKLTKSNDFKKKYAEFKKELWHRKS